MPSRRKGFVTAETKGNCARERAALVTRADGDIGIAATPPPGRLGAAAARRLAPQAFQSSRRAVKGVSSGNR
jgi:hypothetical protein